LRALRFAVERSVPEAVEAAERLVAAFAPRLARVAGFFPVARFLVPDRGPARLLAMSPSFARSMPSTPAVASSRSPDSAGLAAG
jgi:hypothetical protein